MRDKAFKGAARVLELDQRTVAECARTGQLSRRVRQALERALQEGVKLRFSSIPSWETGGERIILRSYPCNRDHAPRFLWSETLEKPNSAVIIGGLSPAKEGLRLPFRKPPPNRSQ